MRIFAGASSGSGSAAVAGAYCTLIPVWHWNSFPIPAHIFLFSTPSRETHLHKRLGHCCCCFFVLRLREVCEVTLIVATILCTHTLVADLLLQ